MDNSALITELQAALAGLQAENTPATASTANNPKLSDLRTKYLMPGSAFAQPVGTGAITSWGVLVPGYIFTRAGPQAFPVILGGPQISMQTVTTVGAGAAVYATSARFPVSQVDPAVVAAVAAYVAANPTLVPVGPALGNPVVPASLPNVTCPITGHSYPAPQPTLESLGGYFGRVAPSGYNQDQAAFWSASGNIEAQAGLTADPANWPVLVDRYCFGSAYMTPAQIAAVAAAEAQWAASLANLKKPVTPAPAKPVAPAAPTSVPIQGT